MDGFTTLLPGTPGAAPPPVAAFLATVLLAVAVTWAGRRRWPLALRRALLFLFLLALLGFGSSLLPPGARAGVGPGLLVAARILALVALIEGAQFLLLDLAFARWLKGSPPPRILRDLATLVAALAAFLLLLRGTLGVNLSSLLATSAMISVVLGLALQDTLGGFFAGLALQMESPLASGDWVQIGETQGRVTQVGWRTVRIVSLDGDEITFPNSQVTRSALLNFSRPAPQHRAFVQLSLPPRHPPHEVLAVLAQAVSGVPGVLASPPPQALVWEYGESGIVYRVRYWIDDYEQVNVVRGAVGARVWYALRRAGIEIGYPTRVLRRPPAAPSPQLLAQRTASALGAVDLFAPLSPEECLSLAGRLHPELYARGETVIRQGDSGDSLFIVTRGHLEVRVVAAGEETAVSTLGPGSFFGEMSLLTGGPRSATVVALEDVEVVPVRRQDFRHVVVANPAVLEAITGLVSRRRDELAESIREGEQAAAGRAGANQDLLGRVRAFFGL